MMLVDNENFTPPVAQSLPAKSSKQDILDITGGDGLWQRRIFYVLLFCSIPGAAQNLAITFLAPDQDYWCARPPEAVNISVQEWKSIGLPPNDKHCSRYENINLTFLEGNFTNKIVPCESWEYDDSFYTSTILKEWNLVCGRDWLISVSKSIFMVGLMVSCVLFGILADRFGRRPTITGSCALTIISSFICAFAQSYVVYITFRFFVAMGVGGYYNSLFVILMEVVNPKMRTIYGIIVQAGWSIGFVLLPGVVWLIRDAFWIQIAITTPSVIFLGVWWMIPESPRWLLSQGRIEEAKETLTKAAEMNGLNFSEILLKKVIEEAKEDYDSGEAGGNFLDLLRTPGLCQICLRIFYSWLVVSFIYYGLSFNTNEMAGDPFVNFALSGAIEFPAYLLSILVLKYLGRRRPCGCGLIVAGLVCLLSYFIPQNLLWLSVAVPTVGKLCVTCLYGIIYVYTSELLPTVVRNEGLGWACFFEQIGSIIAPFVHELNMYAGAFAPFCIYGILALSSGILIFCLPDTHDLVVPDTITEASRRDQTNTSSKNVPGSVASMNTEMTNI